MIDLEILHSSSAQSKRLRSIQNDKLKNDD